MFVIIKRYDGYLIDLDGTMYRGKEKIPAAVRFVQRLRENNIPYLFVTNNSARTQQNISEQLNNFSIHATEKHIFTTSQATANYIHDEQEGASLYVIGEQGLRKSLEGKGFTLVEENPDYVVVGLDRNINYEKLSQACLAIRAGAKFISTNGDIAIPTERGLLPGNGSLTSVISTSTQVMPTFIGKPESIIMEQALKVLGTKRERTLMVGDNYDTDILAGINSNIDTLLVHSGVTTKEMLANYETMPTYSLDTLDDWYIN